MINNSEDSPFRILVAPLNWGLGHATRCMPIIDELLNRKVEVILAGDGLALQLLKHTYPTLPSFEIPGYKIQYARNSQHVLKLVGQLPRILSAIKKEHQCLMELVEKEKIDGIISDNRYGLWHPFIPTAFICHQISPLPPEGMNFMFKAVHNFHIKQIERFNQCWIPDHANHNNLSGKLSHTSPLPKNSKFLGPLSRFSHLNSSTTNKNFSIPELQKEKIDIVTILSGPEPQRSLLEKIILEQAQNLSRPFWLVRGLTDREEIDKVGNVVRISFLTTTDLSLIFNKAKTIISRSGYSSLMDYASLGLKEVILIPTPGQTEQEYLAEILDKQNIALHVTQNEFNLSEALETVNDFNGFSPDTQFNQLNSALESLMTDIRKFRKSENK